MKNKLNEVIGIIAIPVVVFTAISFLKPFSGFLKPIDFLAAVRKTVAPIHIHKHMEKLAVQVGAAKDSLIIPDTTVSSFGDLTRFLEAVKKLHDNSGSSDSTTFHIAYFGDSMIEGDLLTQDLRKSLQIKYGGSGVGFVPVTSITAGFRSSITHTFNESWTAWNFNERPPKNIHLGLSGYAFRGNPGAEVTYRCSKAYKPFGQIHLFYTASDTATLAVKCDTVSQKFRLIPSETVMELPLLQDKECRTLKVNVKSGSPVIYGFNFENGPGVYLDNYSFRGNSGVPLSVLNKGVLKDFGRELNYKLIILHYGLNVVGHDAGDYSWFKMGFRKAIRNIREAFPDATIMLVSVSDKSYHSADGWNTEPDIPKFVEIQAELAAEENVAFWNLYKAMGGFNTMKRWVEEENPRLANLDYTHTNHAGASKIAGLLNAFLNEKITAYMNAKQVEPSTLSQR